MDADRQLHQHQQARLLERSASYNVINENWRGKNNPTERRRIQNRLNQRAFRQRQRDGESPKLYKSRSSSTGSSRCHTTETSPGGDCEDVDEVQEASVSAQSQANLTSDCATSLNWDELGRLINRNLMEAGDSNARYLEINPLDLRTGHAVLTPRSSLAAPAALLPLRIQHEIAHDPLIDILPHPRLRSNILNAIANGLVDVAAFSRSLRTSGALLPIARQWHRGGLIVWDAPEELASWEMSEMFVRQWGFLLHGCEDLLAATNAWRIKRGERPFPIPVVGQ